MLSTIIVLFLIAARNYSNIISIECFLGDKNVSELFAIGDTFFSDRNWDKEYLIDSVVKCWNDFEYYNHQINNQDLIPFLNYFNKSLVEINSHEQISDDFDLNLLSNILNECSLNYFNPLKELLYHWSLIANPKNVFAIKNLAFNLENYGKVNHAISLYQQCYKLTLSADCLLSDAIASPLIIHDELQAKYFMIRIISSLYKISLMRDTNMLEYSSDNLYIMNIIPLNCQYLGYHPHLIFDMYSKCLLTLYPYINNFSYFKSINTINDLLKTDVIIRIGIMSGRIFYIFYKIKNIINFY